MFSPLQVYAAMVGDSPDADARGTHPGADLQTRISRGAAQGTLLRPQAPLMQPGHDHIAAGWLVTVLRHVRLGS